MEEEPVMAAPDIDKLQQEQENFVIEQDKPTQSDAILSHQDQQRQTVLDDLTLDDITTTPREKTREEIIAEAEAAAFANE